jgi:arginase
VGTVDSNEIVLGLGAEPGGLTSAQVRRIVQDIDSVADVVGIAVAGSSRGRSCTCSSY